MKNKKTSDGNRPHDKKQNTCGQCRSDSLTVRSEREFFTYGSGEHAKEISAVVPVYTCNNCRYQFVGFEAEIAYHEAVCKLLRVMSPGQIKEIRKRHDLSRAEFSQLTRLGSATLGRWERGALVQNHAYDQFLYLLNWRDNVERLRNRTWDDQNASQGARAAEDLAERFSCLDDIPNITVREREFQLVR